MSVAITRQLLLGGNTGERRYIVIYKFTQDTSAEISAGRVNVTTGDLGTAPTLIRIQGAISGASAQLLWDATTDVFCWQLPSDHFFKFNFSHYGGIRNDAGTGKTGDLLITTSGLGSGDSGSILFEFITG